MDQRYKNNPEEQVINLKFDDSFDIATGKSRKEMHWRNREITWQAFLNKIKDTHRTAEKLAEYNASKKTRQDEIKDIGGFVGGYINNGRRKAENITHRQLITLDIDFAEADIWDNFTMLYDYAAAVYSTHKHTPEKPRLRLIVPINRPVGTDEYIAIARRLADSLDINIFDDTTFEPSRLMYWPSTAKDGEYVFHYQDGQWLNADELLATYRNWKDASEWPISDRVDKAIQREIKKQGDPIEKNGIVGLFCREFNIHEAIETFLEDEYEPTTDPSRYTFKRGSTAAGLVVYDDIFSYSHHGTDPTSGKLCNAFDLVRLHLYGLQDDDVNARTNITKYPSYQAMLAFAANNERIKKRIGSERMESLKDDFGDSFEEEEPDDMEWTKQLDIDSKGNIKSTVNNVLLILSNDPVLKGKLARNLFEMREVITGKAPWKEFNPLNPYMTDTDDAGIRNYLEKIYGIAGAQKIQDGIRLTLEANSFHPVRDFLSMQVWDENKRVDTLLIDYLGARDSEYVRAVTRKTLTAAVKRIFVPGCKFDYVLVMVGPEGAGKSTLIKELGGDWHSDSFTTVTGKEAYEQVQGVWLVEMAELAGLKKAELETIKHFISKQVDRFRVAYGKRTENFPRQCVFFATTNDRDFLRGETGNRRFWPVDVMEQTPTKDVFNDLTTYEVGQIWAEALQLYKAGETLYLNPELEQQARQHQIEHSEADERVGLIREYLNTLLPKDWEEKDINERKNFFVSDPFIEAGTVIRDKVCVAEIWCECFKMDKGSMTPYNTKAFHTMMRNMEGWELHKAIKSNRGVYGVQKTYVRTEISGNEIIAAKRAKIAAIAAKN